MSTFELNTEELTTNIMVIFYAELERRCAYVRDAAEEATDREANEQAVDQLRTLLQTERRDFEARLAAEEEHRQRAEAERDIARREVANAEKQRAATLQACDAAVLELRQTRAVVSERDRELNAFRAEAEELRRRLIGAVNAVAELAPKDVGA